MQSYIPETIHIAPSILAADFTQLGEQVRQVTELGVSYIHIDVMDGRFVPNITMGPLVVEAVRRVTELPLDVHLMIVEPDRHIEAFAQAGADIITVHLEADANLHRTLHRIRELGCKAGVAINPHTPSHALQTIIHYVDLVNVMTVNPGFGGQKFIPGMMSKVAEIRAMIGDANRAIDLEVDGGINPQTAMTAAQAGANILVVGSAIFQHPDGISAALQAMSQALVKAE
ncbi:MAG: ribulose-phosphate 3-epimerase [Phototrophicales bacterium]